jgi:hypothetical protein
MVNIKDNFDIRTKLRGEIEDIKAGIFKRKIETPALVLQSEQRAIKKKHAECLTELVRLKRKSQEMENSHAQAMATIRERNRVAQENYDAAQERHRAEMAKIAAHNTNPTYEFAPRTQKIEQDQQRKSMNVFVFMLQAILFGGGIVAVGIYLSIKRKFQHRNISCGDSRLLRQFASIHQV